LPKPLITYVPHEEGAARVQHCTPLRWVLFRAQRRTQRSPRYRQTRQRLANVFSDGIFGFAVAWLPGRRKIGNQNGCAERDNPPRYWYELVAEAYAFLPSSRCGCEDKNNQNISVRNFPRSFTSFLDFNWA
jgi:hypothetical protein